MSLSIPTESEMSISIPRSSINNRVAVLDETQSMLKLLPLLKPYLNTSLLLQNPEKYERLLDIYEQIGKANIGNFKEEKYELLVKTICRRCKKPSKVYHKLCNTALCSECVKDNNFSCLECNKPLSSGYMIKLYGNKENCFNCKYRKAFTDCKELCLRCLLITKAAVSGNCAICKYQYAEYTNSQYQCYTCEEHFDFMKKFMFNICEDHIVCNVCALQSITHGSCTCGRAINASDIKDFYEYAYTFCTSCNEHILKAEAETTNCCRNFICSNCKDTNCKNCNKPSLDDNEIIIY